MKLKILSTALISVAITGCGMPKGELITRPANGYDKIVFQNTARVKGAPLTEYTFSTGSVFVQDRTMKGVPVYCGPMTINVTLLMEACIIYDGNDTIQVNPTQMRQATRNLPQGTIKHIKAQP
ncbi:hypothetical protein PsAD13_02688 [Pseudovibrio sp. Ad13]|uniref:hypothetical protein n=1 Tax=Pseudovibrio sp. Ad13 TaxID=989396 RepID=UPI0007AEA466|nr:hypothetical protein [Pseudovibrio sp. Ad13]KZK83291.1 hypothetical protein PsAD13_02688 [Pseudovibrio sp. Ad13]